MPCLFQFKTLETSGKDDAGRADWGGLKLTLRIEDGPFAGRSLDLQGGVLTIGRDAACGLRFESITEISRRHATLTREAASFVRRTPAAPTARCSTAGRSTGRRP